MLAGKRAFEGDDVSDTLAAVIRGEPDWNALPPDVPHSVRALIQGCLRKSKTDRIGDLSTALFVLGQPHAPTQAAVVRQSFASPIWRRALPVLAGAVVGASIAGALVWRLRPAPQLPVTRFAVTLPAGQQLNPNRGALALSPDGTRLVYAADGRLYLRSMFDLEPRELRGTGPAINPVFSPDGRSVAFWGESLKHIAIDAPGSAITISETGGLAPYSFSWSDAGILFTRLGTGIMRVSPNGGKPEVLVDMSKSDELADNPHFLPDGRTLLFTTVKRAAAVIDRWEKAQIVAYRPDTGVRKVLLEGGSDARYVPTGHIVYVSGATLFAVPFDPSKLTVTGGPVPVLEDVRRIMGIVGAAHFAVSRSGTVAYVSGGLTLHQEFVVFDRNGAVEGLKLPAGRYHFPRVSPDEKRLAFEASDGKEAFIAVYELSGESSVRRLTFGGNNRFPVWSGDSRRVAFQSDREGDAAVFWQSADGGTAERLTTPAGRGAVHVPESWSPDGQVPPVQRDEGLRVVAVDILAPRSQSGAVRRCEGFDASDRRDVLARRPLGGISGRRNGPGGRAHLRSAIPANRHQVSDCARRPAGVVARRQGALLRTGASPLRRRSSEDRAEFHVLEPC